MGPGYIMAIDQGTTGTRVIIFDHTGTVCSSGYQEIRQIFPRPGWVEHDPVEIWESVLSCARQALEDGDVKISRIMAIGVTNQRESTIIWRKDTGEPLANSICWQCRRSAEICDALKHSGYEKPIQEKTGLVIDAYFSATKIRWIIDNVPGVREEIDRNNVCAGTIDSWIIWNLSGRKAHVTDLSNASRTMLLNIHTFKWDTDILSWLDIPEQILPTVVASSGTMAVTDPDFFFGARIPVAGDAGDQHAATFGQACFRPGMAKNTYGTALALMMNTGNQAAMSTHGLTTDLAWKVGEQTEYALEGVSFIGGAAIDWLRSGLKLFDDVIECSRLAEAVSDTGGVYLVPAFTGLSAPYWDMYARGLIIGITRGTTSEHIARSALESIAYQTRDVILAMRADCGETTSTLRVDGGASKSDFLMQLQADILGMPVERPVITEMAALGACYLAGLGVGFWDSREELERQWKVERIFEPKMGTDERESLYANWKRAVERSFQWAVPTEQNERQTPG